MGFQGELLEERKRVKLDLLDRKILYLLSINARFSEISMARALKTSREVVHYRMKRMQDDGFLHGHLTLLNSRKLGMMDHDIFLQLQDKQSQGKLEQALIRHPLVCNVQRTHGSHDIRFRVTTQSLTEFDTFLEAFMDAQYTKIKEHTIAIPIEDHYLGLAFLLEGEQPPRIRERKGSAFQEELERQDDDEMIPVLKEQDRRLLASIVTDARKPITTLAKQLGLSVATTRQRFRSLVQDGVICAFIPFASFSFIGYQWYSVYLRTRNIDKSAFLSYLREHPNIPWCIRYIGKWNYRINVYAKSNTELDTVLEDMRKQFGKAIISMETTITLNQPKYVQRVGIPEEKA